MTLPYNSIEKKDAISYSDFIENHAKPGIPVVFKNASSVWGAGNKFTPEFFAENFGEYETWSGGKKYSMIEILDLTAKSTPENPAPYPILFEIPKQIPELLKMVQPMHMNYAQPNWFQSKMIPYGKFGKSVQLFIGGRGNQYGLHKDFYHTNAWITQLYGEKKFVVYPGNQDDYLYAGKEGYGKFISPVNIVTPDLEKYPMFKEAKPLEVTLRPGETIFIPNGLWHTTVAFAQNISLIFDQLNSLNHKAWKKDIYELKKTEGKLKAAVQYGYAASTGAALRLAELSGAKFDGNISK